MKSLHQYVIQTFSAFHHYPSPVNRLTLYLQQAFEGLKNAGRQVRRPDCTLATTDHV